jgi:D-alanyl-lipoteichoic acid acyltransferase DltB (MBOAT superfamily)
MWDWRFLSLILFSSLLDYGIARLLFQEEKIKKRKLLLYTSLLVNLGFLGFFKYFNFFADSFTQAFTLFGQPIQVRHLNIILPVGISFYTFQTLSYTIDVYRRKLEPSSDLISFLTFVSFFPQLVAGPIERASNLLPQFYKKRVFDEVLATDGMRQVLWGLFKKVVIADNCAETANLIFNNYHNYAGSTLALGAIFFAFQIYCDFSGYSDIAIGSARLFGFDLMRNFAFPYFSRDVAEFWRRWHISLSTWFRDYVYIPLGGSRVGKLAAIRNTFIIFLVSGFWHGANWTFLVWGGLHALYFLPLLLLKRNRKNTGIVAEGKLFPSLKETGQMLFTFGLITLAWVFFRAQDISQAFNFLSKIFSHTILTIPEVRPRNLILAICAFVCVEWLQRGKSHALEINTLHVPQIVRWCLYAGLTLLVIAFNGTKQEFIYFQF